MSQAKLAEFLGVSAGTVGTWETGGMPAGTRLDSLAQKLGVSVGWLLGTENIDALHDAPTHLDWVIQDLPESILIDKIVRALRDTELELSERVRRARMFLNELARRASVSSTHAAAAVAALNSAAAGVQGERQGSKLKKSAALPTDTADGPAGVVGQG